jgi:hypothetical protein
LLSQAPDWKTNFIVSFFCKNADLLNETDKIGIDTKQGDPRAAFLLREDLAKILRKKCFSRNNFKLYM